MGFNSGFKGLNILDAFAELRRKATISFVISARPRETARFPVDGQTFRILFYSTKFYYNSLEKISDTLLAILYCYYEKPL